jgi:hypothetical protein
VKFVDRKRKSDYLKKQLTNLEVFDCILPDIYDVENLFAGVSIEDGSFYNNYFLPSCLFYIYQSWLKKSDLELEKNVQ